MQGAFTHQLHDQCGINAGGGTGKHGESWVLSPLTPSLTVVTVLPATRKQLLAGFDLTAAVSYCRQGVTACFGDLSASGDFPGVICILQGLLMFYKNTHSKAACTTLETLMHSDKSEKTCRHADFIPPGCAQLRNCSASGSHRLPRASSFGGTHKLCFKETVAISHFTWYFGWVLSVVSVLIVVKLMVKP